MSAQKQQQQQKKKRCFLLQWRVRGVNDYLHCHHVTQRYEITMLHMFELVTYTRFISAPSSFGLSIYLTQHGCKARELRRMLLIFCLSAPVCYGSFGVVSFVIILVSQTGAFLTFYGMSLGVVEYKALALSLIMLFSGSFCVGINNALLNLLRF